MRLEDISKETLTTVRRVLAGGAIAAVAVFGAAACEDTAVDAPEVEEPGMEGEDGMEGGEGEEDDE
ncbi:MULTISPECIES: hypothetical protein [unclassified Nocardiopsis]|uniref:hypothetical protein n=1 Tax=unclassified Nocardiopsis TaxID=2649073 RepID=UPI00135C7BC4|nr:MULTISPECIES: hypothetical protein [unclassified Nocardiopsis]